MDGRTPISGESAEPALEPSVDAPATAFAPNPRALTGLDVLRLQRTEGNAAVARMLRERRIAREGEQDDDGGAEEAVPPEGAPAPEVAEDELDQETAQGEAEAEEQPPPGSDPPEASPGDAVGEKDDAPGGEPIAGEPPQDGPPEAMRAASEAEAVNEPDAGAAEPHHAHAAGARRQALLRRPAPPDTGYAPPDSGGGSGAAPGGPTHGPPGGGSRVGIVAEDGDKPAKLRKGPSTNSQIVTSLAFNTRVFITGTRGTWFYVTTAEGDFGYIYTKLVKTNLPEPSAKLYRVGGGDTAIGIAQDFYGRYVQPGEDLRFYVNVLEYVNRGHGDRGVYQPNPNDHSRGAWKNVATRAGLPIWIPGPQFAMSLKGIVSSGSLTGGAWARARSVIKTIEDFAIGGAAFVAGLLEGAIGSVKDLLTGLGSLVSTLWKVIKSLFQGRILHDAKHLWDTLVHIDAKEVAEDWIHDFVRRWTDEDIWTRWKFRGWVAGYALAEVAMLLLTDGATLAIKLAGKAGKLGAKLVGFVKDFAAKLPKAASVAVESRLLGRQLNKLGLSRSFVRRLNAAQREATQKALDRWNLAKSGKSQGVVHIVEYAENDAKGARLEKLEEITGRGPFSIKDKDLIPEVTDALDALVKDPAVKHASPGDLDVYWVPRRGVDPDALKKSSSGMIVLKYSGRYSSFYPGAYREFLRLSKK